MPRRKAAEVELLLPEDDQLLRGRKKLVEAEHTIKYSAPVPVTIEEEAEEEDLLLDNDPVDIEKKHKRKTAKTERDELRKKMLSHGVTAASPLKLIIEKYAHSDGPDSGTTAEKSHCTKYGCDEAHLLNQDYMNVAARWGAGRYWFTLYKDGTIVTQWEKRLEPPRQSTPTIQHVNPNDPTSPQVVYQSSNGDGQAQQIPMSIKDIMKAQREALKEQLEMAKLMREAYGLSPEQPQQQPKSEEEILTTAILKQPEVVESLLGGVMKRFGGKGGDSDEPWYADVVRDAVKSGQLAQVVQVAIDRIFNGVTGLFPKGQNNGQTQVATAPIQTNNPIDSQWGNDGRTVVAQEITQGNQSLQSASGETDSQGGMLPAATHEQQQITPEQHALSRLIQNCQRNVPVQVAYQQLINYADAINEQAPEYSIDGYIDLLGSMTTDQVLEFVKALPGGEQVVALPHCREWTEALQKLIKESQEGEE